MYLSIYVFIRYLLHDNTFSIILYRTYNIIPTWKPRVLLCLSINQTVYSYWPTGMGSINKQWQRPDGSACTAWDYASLLWSRVSAAKHSSWRVMERPQATSPNIATIFKPQWKPLFFKPIFKLNAFPTEPLLHMVLNVADWVPPFLREVVITPSSSPQMLSYSPFISPFYSPPKGSIPLACKSQKPATCFV